jgi:hypothetical protein
MGLYEASVEMLSKKEQDTIVPVTCEISVFRFGYVSFSLSSFSIAFLCTINLLMQIKQSYVLTGTIVSCSFFELFKNLHID